MLHHVRVFIAEDDPIVALGLAISVADAHGEVIGPCASIREAFILIREAAPTAAILDVQLVDGEVTPVAEVLLNLGVPVIFHSGVGIPATLTNRNPNLRLCAKPTGPDTVVKRLDELIHGEAAVVWALARRGRPPDAAGRRSGRP
jgi:DNA-binding NarL/FixJ family response regulator